tara:strand:+ start:720 stop:1118 length:399 start_codon:yes stop_codon:yes gene_type:complete
MNKFFYFRTNTGSNTSVTHSVMVPVDRITGVQALNATTLEIYWRHLKTDLGENYAGDQALTNSFVTLNIVEGSRKVVMKAIAAASNATPHNDGTIVIADDLKKKYISKYITDVGTITNPFIIVQLASDVDDA